MRIFAGISILWAIALFVTCDSAFGELAGLQRVGVNANFNFPSFATHAPGDNNRLFVTERGGGIKIIDFNTNNVIATPFLNITDSDAVGEGGLLSMAFHPNYNAPVGTPGRGKFYVYVTVDNNGDTSLGVTSPFSTHVREYTVMGDPATSNVADPASMKEVLQIVRPQSNHVGGWIGFNPQVSPGQAQYLYISSGDGGGANDNAGGHTAGTGNAQDTSKLLGKMLRIDVNVPPAEPGQMELPYLVPPTNPFVGAAGADEIWAYGLRNPFRAGFDRLTGDLWIGDVGQDTLEELDFQPASKLTATNYGWRLREGNIPTPTPLGAPVGGAVPDIEGQPIYWYGRGSGPLLGETVIGGYRYRGPDPDLQGRYFFADANDDNAWQMIPTNPVGVGGAVTNINAMLGDLAGVDRMVSFGEDANGNLYLVDLATGSNNTPNPNTGEVYRILTNKLLSGDFNADGAVDGADFLVWKSHYGSSFALADGNHDGTVNAADYTVWRNNLGANVHNLGSGAGEASSANVPEPTALALVLQLAIAASALPYRSSRRKL